MSEKKSTAKAKVETTEVEVAVREVTFKGEVFTIRAGAFDDLDVLEAWEDGKHVALCRALLGSVQWAKFRSVKRPVEDLYLLLGELLKDEA